MKPILAGVLCLTLGLGIGYLRAASTTSAPVDRTEPEPSIAPHAESRVDREFVPARSAPALPAVEPVAADPRTDRARIIIERAKARGVWTERDRDTFRDELDGLDGPTKADVVAAFSEAVNLGELRIEADVPL